jgi:hypothetical protein
MIPCHIAPGLVERALNPRKRRRSFVKGISH